METIDTIQIGDTVFVREDTTSFARGQTFIVTGLAKAKTGPRAGQFYLLGDENGHGVWPEFCDKV